jgi:hypothetical protein
MAYEQWTWVHGDLKGGEVDDENLHLNTRSHSHNPEMVARDDHLVMMRV